MILMTSISFLLTSCAVPFYKRLHYVEKSSIPAISNNNDSTSATFHPYIYDNLLYKEKAVQVGYYRYFGILKIIDTTIYFDYSNKCSPNYLDSIKSFLINTNQIKNITIDDNQCLLITMKDKYIYWFYIENYNFYENIKGRIKFLE